MFDNLDTELPQSEPDANSINDGNNNLFPSGDQHNSIAPTQLQNLALDTDDLPLTPNLNTFRVSGNINDGGLKPIEQFFQQLGNPPFDAKNQPKPECKDRIIPWGGDKPLPMFAFCCGDVPQYKGPNLQNQKRRSYRRKNCFLCTFSDLSMVFSKLSLKSASSGFAQTP